MKLDWNNLKAFEEVAAAGSLTEAARRSAMSIATLSRRVEQLEQTLDLQLVRRSATGIELTREGVVLLNSTQTAHAAVDEVVRLAKHLRAGHSELPVRVSATETVITTLLSPNLKQLAALAGAPKVDFRVSNEIANLSKQEADIALRLAAPKQDTLVAKRLGSISTSLYASSDYAVSRPFHLEQLAEHAFVLYNDRFGQIPEVSWAERHGLTRYAVLTSSSTLAMLEAVRSGVGLGLLPDYLAKESGLTKVAFSSPPPRPLWLVFHRDARRSKRHRAVRDWISHSVTLKIQAGKGKTS